MMRALLHACGLSVLLAAAAASAAPKAAASPSQGTYAPIRVADDAAQVAEIEMFVGESRVFPAPGVSRIAVGNGALLTASALDRREVILFANAPGTSSLFVWNDDGRHQRVKITIVPGDTARHAREVAAFLATIPKAHASVVGAHIIVEGEELSDTDIAKIEELARRYPQIVNFTNRVGWERMVMLDVKVVEFPVSVLRDIGLAWTPTGGAAIAGIWAPARRDRGGPYEATIRTGSGNTVPVTGPGGTPATLPGGLSAVAFMNLGLNAQLNLLAQEGKASLLAQPQLSARNGSKASFLAGGEIPYAVATRDGLAVQFKPYGVRLDITPRVDRQGVIRATIHTEVSGIDRSVTTSGGPALLSRRTETEFNLREGETLALSGLLQREVSHDVDKVPVLGDLPVLGTLFRSRRFQSKETELVVFVTPTVVDADTPALKDKVRRSQERLREMQGDVPADAVRPAPVLGLHAVPAGRPTSTAGATEPAP
jgi:pilus assembly protein CpaC